MLLRSPFSRRTACSHIHVILCNYATHKYGGMEVSDARRLRQLEDENGKLKRLLADRMLDNVILKELLGKARRRQASGVMLCSKCWEVFRSPSAGPAC